MNSTGSRYTGRPDNLPAEKQPVYDQVIGPETREKVLETIIDLLEKIRPEHRDIMIATEYNGRTFRELSEESEIPVGTLQARKQRTIAELQAVLQADYPDLWNGYFNE